MNDLSQKAVTLPFGMTIAGTGMYVPDKVLSNADLEKLVETSDEWIVQRTGIRERRIVAEQQGVVDMGTRAMRDALNHAGMAPEQLDLLVVATMTPDMVCPSASCQIVAALQAGHCGAIDISVACTGFVAALNTAANFIASGRFKNVGVIGAEVLSAMTNYEDRGTCILFGDGAGAAVIQRVDDPKLGCVYQSLHSDGSKAHELYAPRFDYQTCDIGAGYNGQLNTLQMNGREIFKFAVNTLQKSIHEALEDVGWDIQDLAMIVAHQSNTRILESARQKLGLPEEKLPINIDRYGNTSSASIGLMFHESMQNGMVKSGDRVMFVGLGGGLTWGTSLWQL